MSTKKTVVLVGNGFVKSIQQALGNDAELAQQIADVASLWGEFRSIFHSLDASGNSLLSRLQAASPETALEAVQSIVAYVANLMPLRDDIDAALSGREWIPCGVSCLESFQLVVQLCVQNVVHKFIQAETDGFYTHLMNASDQAQALAGIQQFVERDTQDIALFTTNYDGMCDQIMAYAGGRYLLNDGFGGPPSLQVPEGVLFDEVHAPSRLHNWGIRGHLHGSYKYARIHQHGVNPWDCVKLSDAGCAAALSNSLAYEPIVILDAPNNKLRAIRSFSVLSQYWEALSDRLLQAERILVWGMSFENDQHIAELVRSSVAGRDKELVVIDLCPDMIRDRIRWEGGHYRPITPDSSQTGMSYVLEVMQEAMPDAVAFLS